MRRLALLPILYLSACCSPATLKQTQGSTGGLDEETGGTTSGATTRGTTHGATSGGGTTGGLQLADAGPYDADAGKSPDCQPISYPTPCTSYADCASQGYVCVAHGCQPPACGQCGSSGQQACPFPLQCQNGSCVAVPPGGSGGGNGGSGGLGGTAGNGGASNGGGNGASNGGNGAASNGGNGAASNGGGNGASNGGNGAASNGGSNGGGNGASNGGNGGASNGGASNGGGNGGSGGAGHQPDGGLCTQDPNLQGGWNMTQQYEMAQGLATAIGGVVQAVNDIDQLMQLLQALGAPIPSWVTTLMGDLLNLEYLLSEIDVGNRLVLVNGANSMTYTATENWKNVTLVAPDGTRVALSPNQDGGPADYFYFTSPPPYTVTTCSGVATFDQHDLEGALAGIIPPLLDAITRYATCADNGPCYQTFQQAIAALIDCGQFTPPSGKDAGPIFSLGSNCSQDVDCTNCYLAQDLVCKSGKCKYGCENSYDCGAGFFCDANFDGGPDCNHATVLTMGNTTTSGQTGSSCTNDADCSGNQPGSGTFCLFPTNDGGIPIPNDAGMYVGTCTAGCNGFDNFACAATDVCDDNPSTPGSYSCLTVDTTNQTVKNGQDTGCAGPNQIPELDAGISLATALCDSVSGALTQELTTFLTQLTFNFGVASVSGTCTVQDATDLTNGVWTGDVLFVPITGTFSAQETSKLTDGG